MRNRLIPALALLALFAAPRVHAQRPGVNEDESKVPPYTLPDPLKMEDGTPVRTAEEWRTKRRPELLALFEREMFGKAPGRPANLKFVVRDEKKDAFDGKATRLRVGVLFDGREDGPGMEMLVYLPNDAKGPVPVFWGLNFEGNYTAVADPDIPLPKHWVPGPRGSNNVAVEANRGKQASRWQIKYALDRGYGVATACYCEIEPDVKDSWQKGVRALAPPTRPDDWSAIGGWAWALSRGLDYLETNPRVDAKKVIVIGHSRLGKTSLWAGARDERFAIVMTNDSGAGGAALSRRIFGETVEILNKNFPHWFNGNFKKYSANENGCPIDQHELVALVAPRPVLINSATEDLWADPKGEFLGGAEADSVYRLLGTDGISTKEMPGPSKLLTSRIGYFLRPGKHDVMLEDWQAYVAFADRHLKAEKP